MTPSPSFSTNNILTTNISNDDNNNNNSHTSNTTFTLTLHLVRHAETVANEQGIVLGQSDSPLTEKGIQQAKAAHNSFFGSGSGSSSSDGGSSNDCDHGRGRVTSFWKVFSSDLGRCVQTARLIMFGFKDDDDDEKKKDEGMQNSIIQNHPRIVLDKRLRERAKGIREGRKKSLSHQQILKILQNEQEQEQEEGEEEEEENKKRRRRHNVPTPFLEETEMQVMERFQDWLQETIQDAYKQYCDDDMAPGEGGYNQGSFHVLAVTHSGTLRIVLERLVGKQIPVDATRETSKDVCLRDVGSGSGSGSGGGRLVIPNTSRTVIQFTKSCCCKEEDLSSSSAAGMVVMTDVHDDDDDDDDDDDVGNGWIRTRRRRKDQDDGGGDMNLSSSSTLLPSTQWNATLLDYANVSHLCNL